MFKSPNLMSDNISQKSILDEIFEEMFTILENESEFPNIIIIRLKDAADKELFKNQKEIVKILQV